MQVLKTQSFPNNDKLTAFVNINKIMRKDILIIVNDGAYGLCLFFYAEE